MQTFKQFLTENIYPGGYYDSYGNLKVHFDNAEEKKRFDDNPANDRRSDDWHYEHDEEHEKDQKKWNKRQELAKSVDRNITNTVKGANNIANDYVSFINKQVFGDNEFTDKAVDGIKDITTLNKEIEINRNIVAKLDKLIKDAKNIKHKQYLKELRKQRVLRQQDLLKKKKEYEDRNYN